LTTCITSPYVDSDHPWPMGNPLPESTLSPSLMTTSKSIPLLSYSLIVLYFCRTYNFPKRKSPCQLNLHLSGLLEMKDWQKAKNIQKTLEAPATNLYVVLKVTYKGIVRHFLVLRFYYNSDRGDFTMYTIYCSKLPQNPSAGNHLGRKTHMSCLASMYYF
jgi:hypothetical protein